MTYPDAAAVDAWCAALLARADALTCAAEFVTPIAPSIPLAVRHVRPPQFVRFTVPGRDPFYGYWQPVLNGGPAPLLLHVPGYGAEFSAHPEMVGDGYNVLHINPLGYCTPSGFDEGKRGPGGAWPVLPDVVLTQGRGGYIEWLTDAVVAARWALQQPEVQPNRVATFGTSQGGGGALLLGSLLRERGLKAIAADVPFLTDYRYMVQQQNLGAYAIAKQALDRLTVEAPAKLPAAWHALGLVDTLSHAHRLTMPVLLTGGTLDQVTPIPTIRALFDRLPGTRSYTELVGQGHTYTPPFGFLARGWFQLYV
jgi:cephalosporin-C deacetylase-like acetyl esterase